MTGEITEVFLLEVAWLSGHDDAKKPLGVFTSIEQPLAIARAIQKEELTMTSIDHGVFIWRLPIDRQIPVHDDVVREGLLVFERRFRPKFYGGPGWTEEWFDVNLKAQFDQ